MSDTATKLLQQSRTAQRKGEYAQALELRLEAREADPTRQSAEWLEDARQARPNPGEKERRFRRIPGLTLTEVAAKADTEIEAYLRHKLGQSANVAQSIDDPEIVTPKQWVTVKAGAIVEKTGKLLCGARHSWRLLNFDQRTCPGCGQIEELRETLAVEDTLAFKAAKAEPVRGNRDE